MQSTRILVVDSEPLVATCLSRSLEQHSTFTLRACPSYNDLSACIDAFHPDIVVINLHQDAIAEELEACRMIAASPSDHMIVLLIRRSFLENRTFMLDALEAGADAVLNREDLDLDQLVAALKSLEAGHSLLDPRQVRKALATRRVELSIRPANGALCRENLTAREQEVADLIVLGASTSAIAQQLNISERTVQSHVSSILAKLGVHTRAEAVVYLYRQRRAHRSEESY